MKTAVEILEEHNVLYSLDQEENLIKAIQEYADELFWLKIEKVQNWMKHGPDCLKNAYFPGNIVDCTCGLKDALNWMPDELGNPI